MNVDRSNATDDVPSFEPPATGPSLIVVGLPRSGSSFLAHVLSALADLWVFDDLYVLQKAEAITLGAMSDDQLERFVDRLAWETRARVKWENDFAKPGTSLEEIDSMETELLDELRGTSPVWHDVADRWLRQLAAVNDCKQWGYKTPQDFLHIERLHDVWPAARFVHLQRDPRKIMLSYKNLTPSKGGDGDPRSYHPIAYALYWRMSERHVKAARDRGIQAIATVRFEDLVADSDEVARSLAEFMSTTLEHTTAVESHNSSSGGGTRRRLTNTEQWICERLAGPEMVAAGYPLSGVRPGIGDLGEVARVTVNFVGFQARRSFVDAEKRQSVLNVARNLLPTRRFKN